MQQAVASLRYWYTVILDHKMDAAVPQLDQPWPQTLVLFVSVTLLRINLSGSKTTFSDGPPTLNKGFGSAEPAADAAAAAAELSAPAAVCCTLPAA